MIVSIYCSPIPNSIKFIHNSELCQRFNNKLNLFRSSHSKSNKYSAVIRTLTSSQRASLKGINVALLILIRPLQGCSLLEDAGAHFPKEPLSAINTIPISLLILAEWEIT